MEAGIFKLFQFICYLRFGNISNYIENKQSTETLALSSDTQKDFLRVSQYLKRNDKYQFKNEIDSNHHSLLPQEKLSERIGLMFQRV